MELNLELYTHVNLIEIGLLIALIGVLLLKRTNKNNALKRYRRARNCLIGVFALITADLIFSLLANNLLASDFVTTAIDVLFYTPVAILFTWMCSWLVDPNEDYRLRLARDIAVWLTTLGTLLITMQLDIELAHLILWTILAFWLAFIIYFAVSIIRCFRRTRERINNFYSDDVINGFNQLSQGVIPFVIFGLTAPIAAVMPPSYNTIYMFIGGCVYIHTCTTIINYYDYFELIDRVVHLDAPLAGGQISQADISQIHWLIKNWEDKLHFTHKGITIEHLAADIHRDVSEVAIAICDSDDHSFNNYINRLRVSYAQTLLIRYPKETLTQIADRVGYKSPTELSAHFKTLSFISPDDWRDRALKLMN